MALIVADRRIDADVQVALEYQIPLTSKRVDFMVGGSDGTRDNIVIVELKQWENCQATSRENVVVAFTGGANREVVNDFEVFLLYLSGMSIVKIKAKL